MTTSTTIRAVAAALSVALASLAAAAGTATFTPLGFLDPDNFGPVIAYGISADGNIVVGESNSPNGFQAFRWNAVEGIVGLGFLPNPNGFTSSSARACSADGSVIVGASMTPNSLNEDGSPMRWTQSEGMVWLGSLGGSEGGVARDVSSDGLVIVGYGSNVNFNPEAFRWTADGFVGLGDVAGGPFNSQASAVSGDGTRVIGLASKSFVYDTSFKWIEGSGLSQMQRNGFRTIGMSRDGVYAVGINNGRAARVNIDTGELLMLPHVEIPGLGDTDTAWAANSDGSVVVGMENLNQGQGAFGRAFMWDAKHGTRIIRTVLINEFGLGAEVGNWELNAATCVSDDGLTMAGYGFAPTGEQAAWRVTFPHPCPADLDGDGIVGPADLSILLGAWDAVGGSADLDGNGNVGASDLALLLGAWGAC